MSTTATDNINRRDLDEEWMHWRKCAFQECGFPIDPDVQVEKHDEFVHEGCLDAFCGEHCERCMEEGITLP